MLLIIYRLLIKKYYSEKCRFIETIKVKFQISNDTRWRLNSSNYNKFVFLTFFIDRYIFILSPKALLVFYLLFRTVKVIEVTAITGDALTKQCVRLERAQK